MCFFEFDVCRTLGIVEKTNICVYNTNSEVKCRFGRLSTLSSFSWTWDLF